MNTLFDRNMAWFAAIVYAVLLVIALTVALSYPRCSKAEETDGSWYGNDDDAAPADATVRPPAVVYNPTDAIKMRQLGYDPYIVTDNPYMGQVYLKQGIGTPIVVPKIPRGPR